MIDIRVLATGLGWLGQGIESIGTNVEQLIINAQDEILIGAYSIGTGAMGLLDLLKPPLERKVEVKLIVNRFEGQPGGG